MSSDEKKTEMLEEAGPACAGEEEVLNVRQPKCIFDKITVSFYSVVCFVMSMLLMIIITAATLMRYVFQMDLYGYEEWVKIFAFWLYFMGAGYGAFAGTHISADLISAYLKDGVFKRTLTFVKCLITLGVTLLFTKYGWDYFIFGFLGPLGTGVAIPRTVAWRIPLWTAYAAIFLGLLSMSYYFLWDTIRAGKALFGGKN
ncbi:TRAP transporter small permease subunit [Cloacibacillus sp. An23]|uniref:TRAP transporter small permease n=1 Tax=Cloacibacillus sp. An23 TaxID=1965591 RepID=UPI000B37C61F|nr:TRAP transporter small permease subunit [Cloacibacillus sp. An23]OUO93208.1 C4-dicarboxylate ABC transporter permease [Cloacibacillus sp. An23]